jgi:uncharacterized protein involved in exopolysaccharide biosynthesis
MAAEKTSNVFTETVDPICEARMETYDSTIADRRRTNRTSTLQPIEVAWLLWGNRRVLARLMFMGLILFTLIAFWLPKRYQATTRLMPPDFNSASDMISALPSLLGSGGDQTSLGSVTGLANRLLGLNSPGDLMIGVLHSRTIEDDLVRRFDLMKLYSAHYPEDARKRLESNTDAESDPKTGVISISVEDKDPRRAAAIAQAYAQELNQVLAQVNSSAAHREREFIEQRLTEVKKELDASAKDFSVFASQNSAIDIPEQTKAMVTAAADLQAQLVAAQSMLRGLQQIYTNNNARVRQAQAQVTELQRQMNKLAGKGLNASDGAALSGDELYPSIRQLPLLGVQYLNLYRRSKIDEAVYELLSSQYEMAKMEEARDVPSVQILDPAVVPQKKSSPHRLWIMLLGMCSFFLLGTGWIVGGAYWERTDGQSPWKVFMQEILVTCRAHTLDCAAARWVRSTIVRIRKRTSSPRVQMESCDSEQKTCS